MISTSRWEGLPLALLEAMAHGVPVIATDVDGNRDAVATDVNGVLFKLSEPAGAAAALSRLADDPEYWRKLSAAGRRRAEQEFSAQGMVDATFALYSEGCAP